MKQLMSRPWKKQPKGTPTAVDRCQLSVQCPKCSAAPNQRCVTTGRTGKQRKRKAHTARTNLARNFS